MSWSSFIEYDVPGEVILPREVTDSPAQSVLFVAYEDSFISARTAFGTELRRDGREALAPPYPKV